ncbi:MAG: serine hydrolase, partial [Anaerolineae bacterium]|nr:serine hydrolase [Anaerolineae bacterium]
RLGQLYLQKGMWNGSRLLSEAWVEEDTMSHISNGDDPASDWAQGYGYQFWRCRHNIYRGDGAFGQYCVVMPEQDAVLVVTAGLGDMQIPLNLVWDILLPAIGADALPEDAVVQEKLRRKLSGLHFQPVEGAASSPIADQVSGRTYQVEDNELQVKTIGLDFGDTGCTLHIQTATQEAIIPCGYGRWQAGQTHLFNESPLQLSAAIMSSGAWTAANMFTAQFRRYETPFFHTLVCQFDGDRLTIQTRVNVGFIPPETVILRAHSL